MTPARSMIAAGLLGLLFALPAAAQTPPPARGPAGTGFQNGFQIPGIAVTPHMALPPRMERRDQSEPPARAEDGAEAPAEGCRYQNNKLDLLV